ncbi:siderophore-iron reductase FhuF [Paraburkholderia bonniea]|uniref:siderophore-iron reductase FhuF n=1 Tax=Paraburkholderia bonniea TaxID=2152891 RepID=UPI001FEAE0D3|nr:siderophore-iron reductase FhuF [Paraburkholderia bonniea]WJF91885.1 siderophore-iron reductase FhuF [Paraburkholderia bonniea]WJF95204.1 siderophore-iron reductase FhuF [Paraburkholderia bonniea]
MLAPALPLSAWLTDVSPWVTSVDGVWLGPVPERWRDEPDCCGIALTQLPQQRAALLDAMVRHYGGEQEQHARALLSQWSKYYFRLVALAPLVTALELQRPLAMAPSQCTLVLRAGMPEALYLSADALGPCTDDPAQRYASLCDEHLPWVIETLASFTQIAPRVFWSNAGNLLDWFFEQAATLPQAGRDAAWLFGARLLAGDTERNPLRCPVRWVTPRSACLPTPFRVRRVCCVRYEIPGEEQLCSSCPLLLTLSEDELARQEAVK